MFKTLITASVLTLAAAAPAFAESVHIPYDRTTITDPAAAAALYQKVSDAAKTMCLNDLNETRWMLDKQRVLDECVTDTVSDAIRLSREPALKAYHQAVRTAQEAGPVSATLAMR
ncbi:MAG: UrcA family protein [Alphaproteobacteria bacterium]